jgi:putative flippase GtrA
MGVWRFDASPLVSLTSALPPWLQRLTVSVGPQFFKFGIVGAIGFLVDTATVYALRGWIGIYAAGFAGSAVSVSCTLPLNRNWTFRAASGSLHRQLPLYIGVTLLALALNRSVFVALVALVPICARQPVFAVAAGAISGMSISFILGRSVVFRVRA